MSLDNIFDTSSNEEQSFENKSGAYPTKIKVAYLDESRNGAVSLNLIMDMNGMERNQTIYMTNREKKNYYHPRKADGSRDTTKKISLPGMALADDIATVTTGKKFQDLMESVEDRQIEIFDFESKAKKVVERPVITDLINAQLLGGWVVTIENKQVKDSSGNYVPDPSGATREIFEIRNVFTAEDGYSPREVDKMMEDPDTELEPKALDAWLNRNEGVTQDKTVKPKEGGAARGRGSLPRRGGGGSRPARGGLFNRS